ncbi:STM3941 family protein [Mucilaginibacter kameinonensis]|uniref:STM3941 family protein n=1 Tax=Mucilaginibacter kameinonensis TaxID=452286 RepID=UPI000EF7F0FE|nr:STM3941 family protein [Mucilaginibacter kameinonensis]
MYDSDHSIKIPISNRKVTLLIFGCFAFIIIGVFLWFEADNQIRYPVIVVKAISIACIIFFGAGILPGFKKLFGQRVGMIIDNKGIQDNTGISRSRFIDWSNIEGFNIISIRSTKIILVFVNNSDEIILKESKLTQCILRQSQKIYGTPISIASGTLKISSDRLYTLLQNRYEIAKKFKK